MTDGDFWYATAAKMLAPLLFAAAIGRTDDGRCRPVGRHPGGGRGARPPRRGRCARGPRRPPGPASARRSASAARSTRRPRPCSSRSPTPSGRDGSGHAGRTSTRTALLAGADTLYLCAPAHDQRRLTPAVHRRGATGAGAGLRAGRPGPGARSTRRCWSCSTRRPTSPRWPTSTRWPPPPPATAIQLVTVWQDLAQITARYGPKAATVVNNHRAKVFLSGHLRSRRPSTTPAT